MNKDILKICEKKLTQDENNMLDVYIDDLLTKQKEDLISKGIDIMLKSLIE